MIDFEILKTALKDVPEFEPTLGTADTSNPVMGIPVTEEDPPHDEERDGKLVVLPEIVDSAAFNEQILEEPKSLIQGLIHQGTKVIVGGGSKSFKTWIQTDIAICVAYGQKWLNFDTAQGRVLFVNFEIQPVFFQKRIKILMEAKGLQFESERLDIWNLRGHSAAYGILIPLIIERIRKVGYSLVILDPMYKLYGSANENDASEIAQLLNSLDRVCVETEAAVMFGAHYSKGNQASKESIDRISGSGVFARDPDSIIPFTQHEQPGSFVIEPTLRNLPPVEPFTVTWNFPMMERDENLDPAKLKQQGGPGRKALHDPIKLLSFIADTSYQNPISVSEWSEKAGIARQTLQDYLENMRTAGLILTVGEGRSARKYITEKGKSVLPPV